MSSRISIKSRRRLAAMFPRSRNALMTLTFATLFFAAPSAAQAQDPPPDLHMLLNMDLFQSQQDASAQAAGPGGTSMMDQIRSLNALGYLNGGKAAAQPPAPPDDDDLPPPRYRPENEP